MSTEETWGRWTPQELADKIECEGSLEYFFVDYCGDSFESTPLEEPVKKLREAIKAIREILPEAEEY